MSKEGERRNRVVADAIIDALIEEFSVVRDGGGFWRSVRLSYVQNGGALDGIPDALAMGRALYWLAERARLLDRIDGPRGFAESEGANSHE